MFNCWVACSWQVVGKGARTEGQLQQSPGGSQQCQGQQGCPLPAQPRGQLGPQAEAWPPCQGVPSCLCVNVAPCMCLAQCSSCHESHVLCCVCLDTSLSYSSWHRHHHHCILNIAASQSHHHCIIIVINRTCLSAAYTSAHMPLGLGLHACTNAGSLCKSKFFRQQRSQICSQLQRESAEVTKCRFWECAYPSVAPAGFGYNWCSVAWNRWDSGKGWFDWGARQCKWDCRWTSWSQWQCNSRYAMTPKYGSHRWQQHVNAMLANMWCEACGDKLAATIGAQALLDSLLSDQVVAAVGNRFNYVDHELLCWWRGLETLHLPCVVY